MGILFFHVCYFTVRGGRTYHMQIEIVYNLKITQYNSLPKECRTKITNAIKKAGFKVCNSKVPNQEGCHISYFFSNFKVCSPDKEDVFSCALANSINAASNVIAAILKSYEFTDSELLFELVTYQLSGNNLISDFALPLPGDIIRGNTHKYIPKKDINIVVTT